MKTNYKFKSDYRTTQYSNLNIEEQMLHIAKIQNCFKSYLTYVVFLRGCNRQSAFPQYLCNVGRIYK